METCDDNYSLERLRIVLEFADGASIESAVEVANPYFDLRDSTTGIPLDPCVENLLGPVKPWAAVWLRIEGKLS